MKTIGTTEMAEIGMSETVEMPVMATPSQHRLPTPRFQLSFVHLRAICPASGSLLSQMLFSTLELSKICVAQQMLQEHCWSFRLL
jgi:hypothetical protein